MFGQIESLNLLRVNSARVLADEKWPQNHRQQIGFDLIWLVTGRAYIRRSGVSPRRYWRQRWWQRIHTVLRHLSPVPWSSGSHQRSSPCYSATTHRRPTAALLGDCQYGSLYAYLLITSRRATAIFVPVCLPVRAHLLKTSRKLVGSKLIYNGNILVILGLFFFFHHYQ